MSHHNAAPEMAQDELKKSADAKKKTFIAFLGFSIPESLNFSVIFFMHFSKAFLDFLFNTPMRFIVFPSAAIYGLTKAGLLWRQFHLINKEYKKNHATREERNIAFLAALWETLNGLGTTGAVITGIVGFFIGASVGMGISITFNVLLAASTVIGAAYTGYYAYTAYQAYHKWKNTGFIEGHSASIEYKKRLDKAINNGIVTGFVALLAIGVTLAMVVGFPVAGPVIGITGCLIAAAFSGYHLYHHMKEAPSVEKEKEPKIAEEKQEVTRNAKIHSVVGLKKEKEAYIEAAPSSDKDEEEIIEEVTATAAPSATSAPFFQNDQDDISSITFGL